MSYTLVRGTFHVVGYRPDGDSLRFRADHKSDWQLSGKLDMNKKNHVQLRFRGIDTAETHYSNTLHQPLDLAFAARDRLLHHLKIKNVKCGKSGHVITSADDGNRGTLLVKGKAIKRPIAYVFTGDRFLGVDSGKQYTPTPAEIRSSANYKLVREGHAYVLFYSEMDKDVRWEFTDATIEAYNKDIGIWPYDWSEEFGVDDINELVDEYLIFPKLFRRMVKYMKKYNCSSKGFLKALKAGNAGENDKLSLVSDLNNSIRLSDVLEQKGNSKTITMKYYPEDLVFG